MSGQCKCFQKKERATVACVGDEGLVANGDDTLKRQDLSDAQPRAASSSPYMSDSYADRPGPRARGCLGYFFSGRDVEGAVRPTFGRLVI